MLITLAQLNPTVGDVDGNARLVLDAIERARAAGSALLVCPEMTLLGYPPRDLLLREGVVEACEEAVAAIAAATEGGGPAVIVGHPRRMDDGVRGLRNSASVCRDGTVVAVYDKRLLPGYDIFDEDRYFDRGDGPCVVDLPGGRVGIAICEDLWRAGDVRARAHYDLEPLRDLADRGCDLVVSLNASPFILGKFERHLEQIGAAARRYGVPIVAVNQVGGQDDLVFDGRSLVMPTNGGAPIVLPGWRAVVETIDLRIAAGPGSAAMTPPPEPDPPGVASDLWHALVVGVRDYVRKTGHERVLIGLSGGIDSALTAVIAAAAIGSDRVHGVLLPSRHSSPGSREDALRLAEGLGLAACEEIPIEPAHQVLAGTIAPALPGGVRGLTDENIQARLRGLILMALSNATGALLLTTGNKSEYAVGYATLYGDMNGALAVLGDVVKTRVYDLARWVNAHAEALGFARPPVPERSITKPPSAELREDQTDQDSLPAYDVLDEIIERAVEREQAPARIAAETGFDPALVDEITRMIDRAEYKRHQAAVILKVTPRAFGRGRPMPIVMKTMGIPVESI